jgi:hypothetical protein
MPDTRTIKKIFKWKPLTRRSQGRLKYRWEDNIKQDICQMKIKNWIACVQDQEKWKEVVEKAKTFNWEVQRLEEEEEYCVLSGRGLCDELITRPEESYRLWCVVVCDLETSRMRRP